MGMDFKNRFSSALPMGGERRKSELKVGDRFFQTHSLRSVWIVEKVFIPRGLDFPHAVLIRDGEQTDRRIVAQGALLDQTLYCRDKRGVGNLLQKQRHNLHRRRLDLPRGNVRHTVG